MDVNKLRAILTQSKIQIDNPALYQVIEQLIKEVAKLQS